MNRIVHCYNRSFRSDLLTISFYQSRTRLRFSGEEVLSVMWVRVWMAKPQLVELLMIGIPIKSWRYSIAVSLLAVSYFLSGHLITLIPGIDREVVPIWPPTGINLAALALFGWQIWPGIVLGHLVLHLVHGWSWTISSGIAIIVTLQTLLALKLLRRFSFHPALNRLRDVLGLVTVAGPLSSLFGATLAVTFSSAIGTLSWGEFGEKWWNWCLGDAIAILIITPFLLVWSTAIFACNNHPQQSPIEKLPNYIKLKKYPSKTIEFLLWLCLLIIASWIIFGLEISNDMANYPLEYLPFPFLIWAAFRFGQPGTTLANFLISCIGLWGIVHSQSPFSQQNHDNINNTILYLQAFIGIEALTGLLLAATVNERSQSENRFRELAQTLELKVQERTSELEQKNQELATSFRNLQQTQQQLIQAEKMSSLGQLVAGIAHEINNPVNFIYANLNYVNEYTQQLLDLIDIYQGESPDRDREIKELIAEIDLPFLKEDLVKIISSMRGGTERIRDIVISLRNFSRLDESETKPVDIHEGIESTLLILQNRLKGQENFPAIEVIKDFAKLPLVDCYAGQLNQVFINIINNAIDAIEQKHEEIFYERQKAEPGIIKISTGLLDQEMVKIEIYDNGIGMTKEVITRIFDPFFTTKDVGKGTGLGLSVSYQIIVEKHRGKLECISKLGEGTTFQMMIPIRFR
ncbi:MAG TPA: MASE1 domain-containing protein [Leptolyngbyaceae cyanobacterium]